jgi:acetyl-CoA carboxylase carboxyltransferase component
MKPEFLVSIDGGKSYQKVTNDVRIMYTHQLTQGEDCDSELHMTITHEGLISDVWTEEVTSRNIGTSSQTTEEMISSMVEENL